MNDIQVREEVESPYIFSIPHSGELLARDMEWQLNASSQKFLPNIDWHLNELYGFLTKYKVSIISTPHSRYVVDVNRPPNAQKLGNYRRSLVYNTNTWDEEIYDTPPTFEDVERRIKRYYEPFHAELERLVTQKIKQFGKVYLIDLHSFMGPIGEDVCLGNRHNTTCSKELIDSFYEAFTSEGFNTIKNKVFIGGYITKSYAIQDIVETLQIELRYSNYIEADELDVRKTPSRETTLFYETAFRLERVFEKIGIEKREDEKALPVVKIENIWATRALWGFGFIVAIFLGLMEK